MLLIIASVALFGRWTQPPALLAAAPQAPTEPAALQPFGYGAAVAEHDWAGVLNLGFNWMQIYDVPAYRYPVNVLYRVKADATHLPDLWQWQQALQAEIEQFGYGIEAYVIGNEVNLTEWGWAAPPNAADYVNLLCIAYHTVKAYDPTALVISAGLAPVGRVAGSWQGHSGHNGQVQDEREFLREFLQIGGGNCADAIGYNPLGFSAAYDAEPDVKSTDPAQNCDNGFCLRSLEKIYEIMQAAGYGHERIWALEMGWISEPAEVSCLNDVSWQGRAWQRVTRDQQTANLVGAYRYAREHWPWLAAMFIFNLNFDQAPWYQPCEQMRAYSIQRSAAQAVFSTALPELRQERIYLSAIMQGR